MTTFEELGISEDVLKGIKALGFETPTLIQQQAIPMLLAEEHDLVGLAQTGTGKTAAFGIPLLHKIDTRNRKPQALILAPTRELCVQITKDIETYAKFVPGFRMVSVYGGASIVNQIRAIRDGVQIVAATPGRLIDLIDRKAIDITAINYLVLDEADEMLNMGFKDAIDDILSNTPPTRKTWLFSATMPPEVRNIAKRYMTTPKEITVGVKNSGNANIEHQYYAVQARNRYAALKRIVDYHTDIFGIIFCRTKLETQDIAESLKRDGYNADAIHGDLSQQQRDKVMAAFRGRELQLLIATDVAARGIDVNDITHVINYQLPDEIESYTHRSGRTARAGKLGISIAIVTPREVEKIRQIERKINQKFTKTELPKGADILGRKLVDLVQKVHDTQVNEKDIAPYMADLLIAFEAMSKEDIIKRFVAAEFNRFLEYYRNAPDLNDRAPERGDRFADRGERSSSSRDRDRGGSSDRGAARPGYGSEGRPSYSRGDRYFINLGSVDGLDKGKMLGYLLDTTSFNKKDIGRIDIKGVYSFFEIENQSAANVTGAFKNATWKDRSVRVEDAAGKEGGGSSSSSSSRPTSNSGGTGYAGGFRKKTYGAVGTDSPRREGGFKDKNSTGGFAAKGQFGKPSKRLPNDKKKGKPDF